MMKPKLIAMLFLFAFSFALAGAQTAPDGVDALRINQIQVIGTHNSYHVRTNNSFNHFVEQWIAEAAEFDYTHAPLNEQLDRGVRSLELDVYYDAAGTKVMHVPQYDEGSTCPTFTGCLTIIRDWSRAHAAHVPISVLVELKDEPIPFLKIQPFETPALEQLDREIRGAIPPEQLITPDQVRGNHATLAEGCMNGGWPTLKDARGKIMLILHARGRHAELYTQDRPSLQGRAMFMESQPGKPYASVFIRNNPDDASIGELVKQGYMVRTRADSSVMHAGVDGGRRRDVALASGAQIVSTDFPNGEKEPKTGYVVALPDGAPARCDLVNGPEALAGVRLEK